MCRILALPPMSTRKEAIAILANMLGDNNDGTGEVYINKSGQFVVNKYPEPLAKVIKKGKTFLSHLPHAGWTLVHVRKASVGYINKENTHPFVALNGSMAMVHNGTLPNTRLLSMYLQTCEGYSATSDSGAATELISRFGMKDFTDWVNWGGVFISLNIDGSLEIGKVSGQLALHIKADKTILLASELDDKRYKSLELPNGWFKYSAEGKYVKHKVKQFEWEGYEPETTTVYENLGGVHFQGEGLGAKSQASEFSHLLPAHYQARTAQSEAERQAIYSMD